MQLTSQGLYGSDFAQVVSTQTDLWRVQNQQFSSSEISILGLVLAVQVRQHSATLHVTTEVLYLDYVDHRKVDYPCDVRMQLF